MARIVMIGGGVVGLGAATLLQDDGHEVTVLERDPQPPPDPGRAWDDWERRGVGQFHLLHLFLARYAQVMRAEVSDFDEVCEEAGALMWNPIDALPATLTGGRREGDQRFDLVTARRPVMEAATTTMAERRGVDIRRGVAVRGLTHESGPGGVVHVTGVVTDAAGTIGADLVVDCGGRRSSMPALLREIGSPGPREVIEDTGFAYYGRHYRAADGPVPTPLGTLLQPHGSFSTLTLPADRGTWGVGIIGAAGDAPLRKLLDPDRFEALFRACPLVSHWVDGEPITDVVPFGKLVDRFRTYVVDGDPVATGLLPVGDAWACTNPSLGRGCSIGMLHAVALRDALRKVPIGEPRDLVMQWQELTDETVTPYLSDTAAFDRNRVAQMRLEAEGEPFQTDDPAWDLGSALARSTGEDPDLLRGFLAIINLLERGIDVLTKPRMAERALALAAADPWPGPDRRQLLELLD